MYGKGHDEDQGAQELSEKEVMVKVIWFKTSKSINPKLHLNNPGQKVDLR